jgi:hypothetical protein
VITDNDKRYELIFDSPFQFTGKTYPRLYFSAVSVEKNYVTLHFFPVYSHPRQFDDLPERLRKTLKGKSCFNFKELDEQLIGDIKHMLNRGFELYSKAAGSVNA